METCTLTFQLLTSKSSCHAVLFVITFSFTDDSCNLRQLMVNNSAKIMAKFIKLQIFNYN